MKKEETRPAESVQREELRRNLAMIEAALYVAGRPLDLKTLGSVLKTRSEKRVSEFITALVEEYRGRHTALESWS